MKNQSIISPVTRNLLLDLIIFIGLLVSFAPQLTGLQLHEWIGLAFGGTLILHVFLHWQWISVVTQRFLKATTWKARINYLLGAALFISFTTIVFSGLMESEFVMRTLGISILPGFFWRNLHHTSSSLTLWLSAFHIGLHWRWIINAVKKLFHGRPLIQPAQTPSLVPVCMDKE